MSESSGPTEPDQRVERDVENLISEAATLADDLSDEVVGDANAAPETSDRERRFFESHATSEPDIESQLSSAADQAADASNEIGGAASTDSTAKSPAADESNQPPPESDEQSAIEPSPPVQKKASKKLVLPPRAAKKDSDNSDASAKVDSAAKSEAANGAANKVDGETEKAVALDDANKADINGGDAKAAVTGSPSAMSSSVGKSTAPRAVSPMMARVASMLNGPALILASVLELLDRPFGRLGPNVRMLAGWMSLIFFVAAISLLIFFVL